MVTGCAGKFAANPPVISELRIDGNRPGDFSITLNTYDTTGLKLITLTVQAEVRQPGLPSQFFFFRARSEPFKPPDPPPDDPARKYEGIYATFDCAPRQTLNFFQTFYWAPALLPAPGAAGLRTYFGRLPFSSVGTTFTVTATVVNCCDLQTVAQVRRTLV
jgi:hypothetical protein